MIKKIIKMHYHLILFLNKELRQKRNLKQLIHFIRDVLKQYTRIHLQEYKRVLLNLDPKYREQKIEFDKHNRVKQDLQRALKILQYIDNKMAKEGKSRQEMRQFWCDFTKFAYVRKDVFAGIEKEIG